jgi:hypothetical protein
MDLALIAICESFYGYHLWRTGQLFPPKNEDPGVPVEEPVAW